jgi:hypothetical protein
MQDLNPLFIAKLGAIPQPILAAVALMAEFQNAESRGPVEQPANDLVDIEHVKEDLYCPPGTKKK